MILHIQHIGILPSFTVSHNQNPTRFSGVDLDKDPSCPGIVFPLHSPNKQVSVSSIVRHDFNNQKVRLQHCEARLADTTDNGEETIITYEQGNCISLVSSGNTLCNLALELGFKNPYEASPYLVSSNEMIPENVLRTPIMSQLIKILEKMEYKADTDFVFEHNMLEHKKPKTVITLTEQEKKRDELDAQIQIEELSELFAFELDDFMLPGLPTLDRFKSLPRDAKLSCLEQLCYVPVIVNKSVNPIKIKITKNTDLEQTYLSVIDKLYKDLMD